MALLVQGCLERALNKETYFRVVSLRDVLVKIELQLSWTVFRRTIVAERNILTSLKESSRPELMATNSIPGTHPIAFLVLLVV